jgi:luciferase family oxidoreductase group 1
MKLSIVDLATVAPGTSETDALADALETARHAERHGYHRIWFAEHHMSPSGASHHPELLIAAAAATTSRIRVGSGAVLMNHYSPFKVAEMFTQLEAMFPGRIDLGMGRATAGPVLDLALQQNRQQPHHADHQQQVLEVLAWLHGAFPEEHPFSGMPMAPTVPTRPQAWLLGSSPNGSNLAASLGIGYTFAGFINPAGAAAALRHYRAAFQPQGFGLETPRSIISVNVTVGETSDEARYLAGSPKGFYARLARARRIEDAGRVTVPSPEDAAAELTPAERDEPTEIVDGRWPRFVAGSPESVRATLEQMAAESQADEIMIQDMIADPQARRRSHELLADAFDLPRRSPAGPAGPPTAGS